MDLAPSPGDSVEVRSRIVRSPESTDPGVRTLDPGLRYDVAVMQFGEQRAQADREAFLDACYAYVVDPRPSRNAHHPELDEGGRFDLGDWIDVLEQMVLDGVERREDVAEFVAFLVDRSPAPPTSGAT